MAEFPPIADYGFLSDCEVSCLVAPNGAVEWLCLPRPDSPSIFGSILDRRAGSFTFGPTNVEVPQQRRYVPGTLALETTWHTPTGWLVVTDALLLGPVHEAERRADYRRAPSDMAAVGTLLRVATCLSGRVEVMVNCIPSFGYSTAACQWTYNGDGYDTMVVRPIEGDLDIELELRSGAGLGTMGQRAYGRHALEEGQSTFATLSWRPGGPTDDAQAQAALDTTVRFWRDWLAKARVPDHPWRQYIERSALTLKGLSYAPTGAILAAATTSLPETPGGERNWDYRYTWIRDTSFMLRSLYRLGFDWEAIEYFAFVLETVTRTEADGRYHLQIMYGIGGERELTERTLDHLTGYRHSRPVRVGNGAFDQQQLDVWGMLLDAICTQVEASGIQIARPVWEGVASLVDQAAERWTETDQGIWEVRGEPQHFTASKVMCWVAVDRGVRLARDCGDTERAQRWQTVADQITAEVLDKGVSGRGVFRQHFATDDLDAALLLIPIMGFLPPDDDRVRKTVLAIADELTDDGLVLRYRVDTTDTGFAGREGTFTICSFWLVTALALIGEDERARELCQKLLSFAGPLHLYAEEIDATTGLHLGNFPQAFTHLALIEAVSLLIERQAAAAPATGSLTPTGIPASGR